MLETGMISIYYYLFDYYLLYSQYTHHHVSTRVPVIFMVMFLLQQYKVQIWLAVSRTIPNDWN